MVAVLAAAVITPILPPIGHAALDELRLAMDRLGSLGLTRRRRRMVNPFDLRSKLRRLHLNPTASLIGGGAAVGS
jgi:hypothetical protein